MLYDKRWDKPEIKADPLTLESLVAWLETMPPGTQYNYEDCSGKCLYGLYMAFHGVAWAESGAASSRDSGQERADFCVLVYAEVASEKPSTFGAALTRARKALVVVRRRTPVSDTDYDDDYSDGECWQCGGEGRVAGNCIDYCCVEQDDPYCEYCSRVCDVCHPPTPKQIEEGNKLREILKEALAPVSEGKQP